MKTRYAVILFLLLTAPLAYFLLSSGQAGVQARQFTILPAWRLEDIPSNPVVNEDGEIRGTVMAPDGVGIAGSYKLKGQNWGNQTPEVKRQAVLDAINVIVNNYNSRVMAMAQQMRAEVSESRTVEAEQFTLLPAWRMEEIPVDPIVNENNEICGTVMAPDGVAIAGSYQLKGRDWSKETPEVKRQAMLDAVNAIVNEYNARVMAASAKVGAEVRDNCSGPFDAEAAPCPDRCQPVCGRWCCNHSLPGRWFEPAQSCQSCVHPYGCTVMVACHFQIGACQETCCPGCPSCV